MELTSKLVSAPESYNSCQSPGYNELVTANDLVEFPEIAYGRKRQKGNRYLYYRNLLKTCQNSVEYYNSSDGYNGVDIHCLKSAKP